jgi:hypothetical protein
LKDAVRVDGKTYHPICYQDVRYEVNQIVSRGFHSNFSFKQPSNEKTSVTDLSSTDTSLPSSKFITDGIGSLSSDSQMVDSVITDNVKFVIEPSLSSDDSVTLSSMSFFDLVGTIFQKKEDIKPIEQVTTNVEIATNSEEIPLLTVKH